jgi:hypothetical protein
MIQSRSLNASAGSVAKNGSGRTLFTTPATTSRAASITGTMIQRGRFRDNAAGSAGIEALGFSSSIRTSLSDW